MWGEGLVSEERMTKGGGCDFEGEVKGSRGAGGQSVQVPKPPRLMAGLLEAGSLSGWCWGGSDGHREGGRAVG